MSCGLVVYTNLPAKHYDYAMVLFTWNAEKNAKLQQERGVSFEALVAALEAGGLLANLPHPNQQTYSHQRILVVNVDGYAYEVPCIPTVEGFFLVTAFPSRRATQRYLRGEETP